MKLLAKIEISLGIWIMVSPWLLGFSRIAPALWSSIVAGALVALAGLWRMFGERPDKLIK